MFAAPQHGPRPLPLFLDLLRNETAAFPDRRDAALAGLRAYQSAPRGVRKPAPARFRKGRARLRGYGGTGRPVVVVPSLINPPHILDLTAVNSLMRWLATQGVRPFLLDWGAPTPADRDMDIGGHVTKLLVPLLRKFEEPPVLVGYCLGGTMAMAAASLTRVAGLATIASPWKFDGYGPAATEMQDLWRAGEPVCDRLGLAPMELLQSGFWRLDPARTIAKYEAFGRLDPDSDAARGFVALEDWANDGAPLTYAAARQVFEEFIAQDTPGRGAWRIDGTSVGPAALDCPAVEFVSLNDRIVPAATAVNLPDRRDLGAGHVGMIVGSRGRQQVWEPLARWIAALQQTA